MAPALSVFPSEWLCPSVVPFPAALAASPTTTGAEGDPGAPEKGQWLWGQENGLQCCSGAVGTVLTRGNPESHRERGRDRARAASAVPWGMGSLGTRPVSPQTHSWRGACGGRRSHWRDGALLKPCHATKSRGLQECMGSLGQSNLSPLHASLHPP